MHMQTCFSLCLFVIYCRHQFALRERPRAEREPVRLPLALLLVGLAAHDHRRIRRLALHVLHRKVIIS